MNRNKKNLGKSCALYLRLGGANLLSNLISRIPTKYFRNVFAQNKFDTKI
jgi:hypothetical protein